jgi:hypothetical protein
VENSIIKKLNLLIIFVIYMDNQSYFTIDALAVNVSTKVATRPISSSILQ